MRAALNKFGLQDSQVEDYRYPLLQIIGIYIEYIKLLLFFLIDVRKFYWIVVLLNVFYYGMKDHGKL